MQCRDRHGVSGKACKKQSVIEAPGRFRQSGPAVFDTISTDTIEMDCKLNANNIRGNSVGLLLLLPNRRMTIILPGN